MYIHMKDFIAREMRTFILYNINKTRNQATVFNIKRKVKSKYRPLMCVIHEIFLQIHVFLLLRDLT